MGKVLDSKFKKLACGNKIKSSMTFSAPKVLLNVEKISVSNCCCLLIRFMLLHDTAHKERIRCEIGQSSLIDVLSNSDNSKFK